VLSIGNLVKATLGSGNDTVGFIGPQQVVLTGGSGAAIVLAAGGNDTFTAGSGSLSQLARGRMRMSSTPRADCSRWRTSRW
jgi:hypothetical protein